MYLEVTQLQTLANNLALKLNSLDRFKGIFSSSERWADVIRKKMDNT